MEERRRFPRRPVEGASADLPVAHQVRVVDISANGVLLHTTTPLAAGTKASLCLSLAGQPFAAEVVVQRTPTAPSDAAGYSIGAKFVSVSPKHLNVIERFLAQS
jgi:hypothetical protein